MGLDAVELIMETEEIFGITITDAQAASIVSVSDFISLVQNAVDSKDIDRPCLCQHAFHRIRLALTRATKTPRSRIKLTTSIKSLFPPPRRNQTWLHFQRLITPLKLDHPSDSLLLWMPGTVADLIRMELVRKALILTANHDWSHQEVRQIVRMLVSDYSGSHRFRDHARLVQDLGLD
jgi:hypothetical protein